MTFALIIAALVRLSGREVTEIARAAKVNRVLLQKAVNAGEEGRPHPVSEKLYRDVCKVLGFDVYGSDLREQVDRFKASSPLCERVQRRIERRARKHRGRARRSPS